MYIRPLAISRTFTVRLLPPGLAGGRRGSISAHFASVRVAWMAQVVAVIAGTAFGYPIGSGSPRVRPPLLNHNRFIRFHILPDRHLVGAHIAGAPKNPWGEYGPHNHYTQITTPKSFPNRFRLFCAAKRAY